MTTSLKEDVAANTARRRELFQRGADRIVAARVELAAAITDFAEAADAEKGADGELDAWIASYRNPTTPNPAPIVPEVAAPAPAVEPPVFTTVDSADLTPETTSGGFAPVVADELNVIDTSESGTGGTVTDPAE